MPRTIVYATPRPRGDATTRDAVKTNGDEKGGDGYTERLSKYIPAEVLAAFLPLIGLTDGQTGRLQIALLVGLAGTLIYLYMHARQETDASKRPRPFFYLLAAIAFVAWAVGTSEAVRGLLGWDATGAQFGLAIAAFSIPALDLFVDMVWPRSA
jgi:hypothetical protein